MKLLSRFSILSALFMGTFLWGAQEKQPLTLQNLHVVTFQPGQALGNKYPAPELVQAIHNNTLPAISSIDINNQNWNVHKGIALNDEPIVFLYARGNAKRDKPNINASDDENWIKKGGCIVAVKRAIEANAINNVPCITFDFDDTRNNFGQKEDAAAVAFVYDAIKKQSPNAGIVLIGDGRGATAELEFLASYNPKDIKAFIGESVFFEMHDIAEAVALTYLPEVAATNVIWKWIYFIPDARKKQFVYFLMYCYEKKWLQASCEMYEKDNLMTRVHKINPDIPMILTHRLGDRHRSDRALNQFNDIMQKRGADISLHTFLEQKYDTFLWVKVIAHSKTLQHPSSQDAVNTFLKQHKLPYNETLA